MKTLISVLVVFVWPGLTQAAVIPVPGSGPGNAVSGDPFSFALNNTMRYQQVYDASAFAAIDSGGGWITALAFRFNDVRTVGGSVPGLQIDLSTTSRAVDGLSTVFANNVGSDNTLVISPGAGFSNNTPGAPSDFPVMITLNHSFFYNPALGNLLMDVRVTQSGGIFGFFDASNALGDPISKVYAVGVNSSSGQAFTSGLNTAFIVTPIPEPGSICLLSMGISMMAIFITRTKRL